jgi:hypothetical protein
VSDRTFMQSVKQWNRMCLSKSAYRTQERADRYSRDMTKKYGVQHYPYCCPHCFQFHLTTKAPQPEGRIA